MLKYLFSLITISVLFISCKPAAGTAYAGADSIKTAEDKYACDFEYRKTDEEWKSTLTEEQYKVLRGEGTERPFNNRYYNHKEAGIYTCAGCNNEIFTSETKFESGSGWPSFYQPLAEGKVMLFEDKDLGMIRTEVICSNCGGHLGHVFDDGPKPTGLRYCINSAALNFVKTEK